MSRPHHSSPRRRPLAAALLAGVAALALTAAAPAAPGARAAGPPACQTGGLVTWLDLPGNGAAGSIVYSLDFTNLSGHKCTLRGFPGVSAINLRGAKIGKAAGRDHGRTTKTITLKKGATAVALLKVVDNLNFPRSSCGPVTAAGLRVFPPNQKASRTVPFPFGVCSHGPSTMSIQVVRHD
jgi:hypothetical protein